MTECVSVVGVTFIFHVAGCQLSRVNVPYHPGLQIYLAPTHTSPRNAGVNMHTATSQTTPEISFPSTQNPIVQPLTSH